MNPKIIHKIVRTRVKKTPPSLQDIEKALDAIAEELKQIVVDGRTDAYQFEERKLQASTAAQRARKWVDSRWRTLHEKLDLIPGKEAITRLSEWAKENFDVSFGPAAVWRAFTKGDVPAEILTVLEAIEQNADF